MPVELDLSATPVNHLVALARLERGDFWWLVLAVDEDYATVLKACEAHDVAVVDAMAEDALDEADLPAAGIEWSEAAKAGRDWPHEGSAASHTTDYLIATVGELAATNTELSPAHGDAGEELQTFTSLKSSRTYNIIYVDELGYTNAEFDDDLTNTPLAEAEELARQKVSEYHFAYARIFEVTVVCDKITVPDDEQERRRAELDDDPEEELQV